MTTSYKEAFGIVSFETDPQTDINADAKCWHQRRVGGLSGLDRHRGRRAVERRLHPDPGGFGPRDAAPLPRPF